ncbi:MAG: hypothetical protein V9H69_02405 [Anaerolineae bacterium]
MTAHILKDVAVPGAMLCPTTPFKVWGRPAPGEASGMAAHILKDVAVPGAMM